MEQGGGRCSAQRGAAQWGQPPPNLWDPGTSTGCPWGCLPLLLLCPGCCPQCPRWPPQTLAAFSTSPPLRWGGRAGASGGSTAGTPQRTVQSSGCTFGVGGWGGSRRCLRVVTPLPLEPPSSGHPRSQQPQLLREPPQEAVAQRQHGKTTSRGASSNVARARAGSGTLAAPGDVLSLPLLGGHAAQERVALWKASRTWKPHETVEAKDRFSDTDHLRRESSRGRRISEKRRGRGRGEESKKQRNEAKEKERKAGGTRPSE